MKKSVGIEGGYEVVDTSRIKRDIEISGPTLQEIRKAAEEYETIGMDYIYELLKPEMEEAERKRKEEELSRKPELKFNLDDQEDFRQKILELAKWVYNTLANDYDPYRGHMLCREATEKFINYLEENGISSEKINRYYKIKNPEGEYDESFGHVYLIIPNGDENILVDPTYLQWVSEEERKKHDPVLIIRYKNEQELKNKFSKTPIRKASMIIPFYLGFNSPEAKKGFKNINYTVESEECIRIDG